MNTANVIVRFMSLLDVALVLLGVLMLALMQTSVSTPVPADKGQAKARSIKDQVQFIYLFAGWEGDQNGLCYLLNEKMEIGRQVSMNSAADIESHLKRNGIERSKAVAILVYEENGWFSEWKKERISEAEKIWDIKVIEVFDITISRNSS